MEKLIKDLIKTKTFIIKHKKYDNYRKDKEFCKLAVLLNNKNFQYVDKELREDIDFIKILYDKRLFNVFSFSYIDFRKYSELINQIYIECKLRHKSFNIMFHIYYEKYKLNKKLEKELNKKKLNNNKINKI